MLGGLDSPTSGRITVCGRDISTLSGNELADYLERSRELAPLKVFGFRDKQIGRLLISQNILLTIVGVIIGLPSGVWVLWYLCKELAPEYELSVYVGAPTYIISLTLTFGVSLFVGMMVSRKNKEIDMVEALKGAE